MSKTTIPTGGITADAINSTLIADDAISEEHLDATAITGHTALAATPADTDELIISDAGTLKRIDFSHLKSGGLVFIQSQSVSSNTSQINFDSVFSGTYGNYLFVWDATSNTDGADIHFNFRTTAPANHTSSYYAAVNVVDHLGNNDKYVQSNDSKFILAQGPYNQTSVDFPAASGYCVIQNPFSSSFRATMHMQNAYHTTNGDFRFGSGGLYINAQTQFGGFGISASANDINNMTGRVYGIVNS